MVTISRSLIKSSWLAARAVAKVRKMVAFMGGLGAHPSMRNSAPKRIIPVRYSPSSASRRRRDLHPGMNKTQSRAQNVAVSDSE